MVSAARLGLASAVALLSLAVPVAAQADGAGTGVLYVAKIAACSDSGPGTTAVPYCTAQAAVDAAQPGQTVTLEDDSSAADTIEFTHSGTAAAPITLTARYPEWSRLLPVGGLSIAGADDVTVRGLAVHGPVSVLDAQQVTLDTDKLMSGVQVDNSAAVTVSRDFVSASTGPAVEVQPGSSGVVVATDEITGSGPTSPSVAVTGGTGTDVVGDTISAECGEAGVSLSGGSTGGVIENNAVTQPTTACATAPEPLLQVLPDSVSGTDIGYNNLDTAAGLPLYDWNGTDYTSPAALLQATGEGQADLSADPGLIVDERCTNRVLAAIPTAGSPLVDSADALAPGETGTDLLGDPRLDNLSVTNSGTGVGYYDRGAVEQQLCMGVGRDSKPLAQAVGPREVELAVPVGANWSTPTAETVDWGDGTTSTGTGSSASTEGTVSSAPYTGVLNTLQHTYARPGSYEISYTATADGDTLTQDAGPVTLNGSDYVPVAPQRLLDTRSGTGTGGVKGPVAAHGVLRLQVAQATGLPSGSVTAVVLNVTAVSPTSAGYLAAYPDGRSTTTSFLNFTRDAVIANQVTVPVSSSGYIDLRNGGTGTVNLVADLQGYYTQQAESGYVPAKPVRLLDTRRSSPSRAAGTVPAKGTVTVQIAGAAGLPATGVTAVVLNVTEADAGAGGFVTAYPGGSTLPVASDLNFTAGTVVPNLVTVPLGANGTVTLYNGSAKPLDLIADLQGSYQQGTGLTFTAHQVRLLDTRPKQPGEGPPTTVTGAPLAPGATLALAAGTTLGWQDASGSFVDPSAVLVNTTVTGPTAGGWLALTPQRPTTAPTTSNVNFTSGQTVAAADTAMLGTGGTLYFYNGSRGRTDLVADAEGYFG